MAAAEDRPIIHDSEFALLQGQHADAWMKEDADAAARLAEIRERNGARLSTLTDLASIAVAQRRPGATQLERITLTGRELEESATDRVFHWLGKSPVAGSACFKSLQRV